MVPYLLKNTEASPAQAFEHARVGGWRQFTRSPYARGDTPQVEEQAERFLGACVTWERAWESLIAGGLTAEVQGDAQYLYRLKEACRRLGERASGLLEHLESTENNLEGPYSLTAVTGDSKSLPRRDQSDVWDPETEQPPVIQAK